MNKNSLSVRPFDRLVADFFEEPLAFWEVPSLKRNSEVTEDYMNYFIRMEVPGYQQEELDLTIKDNRMVVSGHQEKTSDEKNLFQASRASFERSYSLPQNVIAENVSAEYKNGILVVTIPKRTSTITETKKIPIKT